LMFRVVKKTGQVN